MSNRASSIIPIPELIGDDELIPLVNERLLRVDGELGRLDALVDGIVIPEATTSAQNSGLAAVATGGLVCGAAFAPIPGCAVTLDRDGVWLITGVIFGAINVGAVILAGQALVTPLAGAPVALAPNLVLSGAAGTLATVSQTWLYPGLTGDAITLEAVGVGSAVDPVTPGVGYSSTISALWVSP